MSFASGFFNSVDHDRLYDATDISRLFDGLIRDGIFASIGDCLVVKQSNQMNVTVGTGRAWFNHTWSYNDALYPVTIPPSEILMDRIDAVVLEINSVESVRANSIKLIKGTPSSTPAKPALTNTKEVHQYPLAYVTVGKEVTSIRQADIENCVGTSACPFVTGILEVISIEQLIPQWKDILNRFVEENTANFNTWMNGEKQDYQAWLTAAKKEITDWQATSKSDYQKWYDSIKNGYDQWFATIKAAYDANWSTFQQWEKASQTEFDKWFENMKNKLEGDLGAKLTLETEKLGKEKVSLIESTKTDLIGTVEAPLMLGNATRNLLHYPYVTDSGSVSHGVTMTYTKEGTIAFDGTVLNDNVQPGFALYKHAEKLFDNGINTLYSKYDTTIKGSLRTFFQIFKNGSLVTNVETLSKNDYDWTNHSCNYMIQYHKTTGDVNGTVSNIRIVTDADDPFVPYSGYDIKTIGKNLIPYPYVYGSSHTKNGVTFTVDPNGVIHASGTANATTYYILFKNSLLPCLAVGNKYTMTLTVKNGDVSVYLANTKGGNTDIAAIRHLSNGTKSTTFTFTRIDGATDSIGLYIASGTAVTDCQIQVQLEEGEKATDIEQYQTSTTKITKDTEFPNFDLKSFDGATHIISPGNIQSFHADAPNGKYLLESIKKSAESGGVSYGSTRPTNPKLGDLWVNPDSSCVLYVYSGKDWYPVETGIYISENGGFPSNPFNGQLCYHVTTKMLHVYIPYGGSFGGPGWYAVGSEDPGGYYYGASAPTNTKLLWINTSGVARFYNGSAWAPLAATWG